MPLHDLVYLGAMRHGRLGEQAGTRRRYRAECTKVEHAASHLSNRGVAQPEAEDFQEQEGAEKRYREMNDQRMNVGAECFDAAEHPPARCRVRSPAAAQSFEKSVEHADEATIRFPVAAAMNRREQPTESVPAKKKTEHKRNSKK
jgi:hypothetical protein